MSRNVYGKFDERMPIAALFQNIHFLTENLFGPIRCPAAGACPQERWRKQPSTSPFAQNHPFHCSTFLSWLGRKMPFTSSFTSKALRGGIDGGQIVYVRKVKNVKIYSQDSPGYRACVMRLSQAFSVVLHRPIEFCILTPSEAKTRIRKPR